MSEMNFPALTVQDYGRGAYLVTTAENPIPLRSVAYVGDESTQILNADDGETARRFAYLFAAAPKLLKALRGMVECHHVPDDGLEGEELAAYEQAEAAISAATESDRPQPAKDADARQILITELWNRIDALPEPEPFWQLLCAICPDAFDDPRDVNSLRFKYAAETAATA